MATKAIQPAPKKAASVKPHDMDMIESSEDLGVSKSNLSVYSDKPMFDNTDLFIPKLRLAQGLTQEVQAGEARPGQWLVLGAVPMETVTIVPIGMARRRELRDAGTRSVICRSSDAVNGIGVPGGYCVECPLGQWSPAPVKKGQAAGPNQAPVCTFIYSYMVFVVESKKMAIMELSRTGELAGRMLNTMIVQSGFGNFGVKLSATSKQGPKGTFYAPSVSAASVSTEVLKTAMAEASAVR